MPDSTSPAPLPAPDAGASTTPATPVAPASTPAAETERRSPSALNKRQVADLDETEQICLAAQKPDYAAMLTTKKITPAIVAGLLAAILAARRKSNTAVVSTKSTTTAVVSEDVAEETLLRTLRQAQAAAKQEYAFTEPARLGGYFVGERINQSRALLEQTGQGIIDQSNADRPGGMDTSFIDRVTVEFETWKTAKAQPGSRRSQAKTERAARNGMVEAINQGRIQIQLAADQSWPPGVPANEGVRGEFHLQPNRPFTFPT